MYCSLNELWMCYLLQICSFRELFSGRFSDEETSFLLERFNRDLQSTINFVMLSQCMSSVPLHCYVLTCSQSISYTLFPSSQLTNLSADCACTIPTFFVTVHNDATKKHSQSTLYKPPPGRRLENCRKSYFVPKFLEG